MSADLGAHPSDRAGHEPSRDASRPSGDHPLRGAGDFSIGGDIWPGVSKVLEEAGELSQVLGKLIGSHGDVDHFDGTNLRARLVEELGDLLGAISYFMEVNDLPRPQIFERKIRKYNLFWEWHGSEAIATEARRAATTGAVHEGAGRKASPKPNHIGETNDR